MATWMIILGFAIASSIGSLGVGMCYGLRSIRVGLFANLFIAIICLLVSAAGILFGNWLALLLPGILPLLVGAMLLFILGLRIILYARPQKRRFTPSVANRQLMTCNIKTILEHPEIADTNQSGELDLGEAIILGIALSANPLTYGLGAGLLGFSPHAISITAAVGSFISIWVGYFLGNRVAPIGLGQFSTTLSGVILLAIATYTLV